LTSPETFYFFSQTRSLSTLSGVDRVQGHVSAYRNLTEEAGLRDRVKVLVGGAPVNQRYADEIGADAYAPDAGATVEAGKNTRGAPLRDAPRKQIFNNTLYLFYVTIGNCFIISFSIP